MPVHGLRTASKVLDVFLEDLYDKKGGLHVCVGPGLALMGRSGAGCAIQ